MNAVTHGFDLYVRSTDVNGKATVREHRAWDKDRLLASLQTAAAKENAKQKDGEPRRAKVEQITREQYLAARGK